MYQNTYVECDICHAHWPEEMVFVIGEKVVCEECFWRGIEIKQEAENVYRHSEESQGN